MIGRLAPEDGMRHQTLFDDQHQRGRTRACQQFLRHFLSGVPDQDSDKRVLDVACGVGLLSDTLSAMGFDVTAIDARPENIAEARRRVPGVRFDVFDVEAGDLRELGSFRVVVCFGLLYHCENPLRVVRGLFEITAGCLVIESLVAPGDAPSAMLMNEPEGEDKALRGVAFVPTESCLVKMCYRAGFGQVYGTTFPFDNAYFRDTLLRRRRRTVLVAAKRHLPPTRNLVLIPEPHTTRPDLWQRIPRRLAGVLRRGLPGRRNAAPHRQGS